MHKHTLRTLCILVRGILRKSRTARASELKHQMIIYDHALRATMERVRQFQHQVANVCRVERNPQNYRLSASGYRAELDRMTLEVRDYLWSHPTEAQAGVPA